ncbi:MAG: hypothetical protein U9O94_03765 [Nanoarchaeota archaeon]|nr:hypothetical protein [Nanoarchaeota archaeon]
MNNKFLKNKKADLISFNTLYHVLEIVFVISIAIFVIFIVRIEKSINTFPVESEILFNRILYSNNGLWFYDEGIDRLYPGIIDFESFSDSDKIESLLMGSVNYGDKNTRAAAELSLEEKDNPKKISIYYNKEKYQEWVEWYKAGVIAGEGARQGRNRAYNVLIKKENDIVPGFLNITVLIPNR